MTSYPGAPPSHAKLLQQANAGDPRAKALIEPPSRAGLKVVCAWCGQVVHDGPGPAEVSHGICSECSERVLAGSQGARS